MNRSRRHFFRTAIGGIFGSAAAAAGQAPRSPAQSSVAPPPPIKTMARDLRKPTTDELERIARSFGLDLTTEELASVRDHTESVLESYRRLDQFVEPTLPVEFPRDAGYRPTAEQNPLNAWYRKCSIKGAPAGKLSGKKIALKDNICLAGIPMAIGSNIMEGFIPDVDATVVTRILREGGEITGKAVCENLCLSGESHTSNTGPVLNPHDATRTAGGSSSGSAALVVSGECDMTLGCDQGGSIRIPSSYSGACGLKPTYGLVPYTAIFPFEMTLDHVGPMARTAADCALLLEAIAGPDHLDPRQPANIQAEAYAKHLTGNARGLRIGIVREGFGWPNVSEHDVDGIVHDAAHKLTGAGATVREISIPLHRDGIHFFAPIRTEGATMLLMAGNGTGTGWKGYYATSLMDFFSRSRRVMPNDLPDVWKRLALAGQYLQDNYHGHYYAKAQNLARILRASYDEAFTKVDALVMPTTPTKAPLIPPPGTTTETDVGCSKNTAAFDVTGHPAVSVPCGTSEGLPVGMMIVGRHWEDGTILRIADAFERLK
jgi:amidase